MRRSQVREDMTRIFIGDLGACVDVQDLDQYPGSINDAWITPFRVSKQELDFKLWYVEAFAPYEIFVKAKSLMREIDNIEKDLNLLVFRETGVATNINKKVQTMRKCRALVALWPDWKTVVDEARNSVPLIAQQNLYRLCIVDNKWLER